MTSTIIKLLSAAAPIVASVASSATNYSEPRVERIREEPKVVHNNTNNLTVTITNNFYVSSAEEAQKLSSNLQQQMLESFSSVDRFKL